MRPSFLIRLAVLFAALLTLPGCGVIFVSSFDGTEVFKDIELSGEFAPGTDVFVTLELNQAYPVPVWISCRYEDTDITDEQREVAFNERTESVFEQTFEASPETKPEDEMEAQVVSFKFSVPEPGDYFIACFTPSAPENGIGQGFPIEEGGVDFDEAEEEQPSTQDGE